MQKFTDKSMFKMTEKEMQIDCYALELNTEYLINKVQEGFRKWEDNNNKYLIHKSAKSCCNYQVTYIWKKDGKPAGHREANNLKEAAKELDQLLGHTQFDYIPVD